MLELDEENVPPNIQAPTFYKPISFLNTEKNTLNTILENQINLCIEIIMFLGQKGLFEEQRLLLFTWFPPSLPLFLFSLSLSFSPHGRLFTVYPTSSLCFSSSYETSILFGIALCPTSLTAEVTACQKFWPGKWTCNVDISREWISRSKREDLVSLAFLFVLLLFNIRMVSKATAVLSPTQDNKQEDISQQAKAPKKRKGRYSNGFAHSQAKAKYVLPPDLLLPENNKPILV